MIYMETIEKNWYTIKVQNNRERSVSEKLKSEMVRDFNEQVNVMIPTKTVSTLKSGKIQHKEQIMYPGYIFVETGSVDKVLHFVKIINGMSGVLKDSQGNPIVMRRSEIDKMAGVVEEVNKKSQSLYMIGEEVSVKTGPFSGFKGKIQTIDFEKDKLKLEVFIFGRSTMLDLTLNDISK
jgi:transcriptional antiterminator NusG